MGCQHSGGSKEENEKNKAINGLLKREREELPHEVKLLLLGAGESGKSTIAKQMKIIHLNGYTDEEKKQFIVVIHQNILQAINSLLQAAETCEYTVSKKNRKSKETVERCEKLVVSPELGEHIAKLWSDKAVQKAYARASEFQILDSTEYYFEHLERITQEDYLPTEQDILRSRAKTTGVTETEFEVSKTRLRMVDVGGQRSERKKWIHCFQDVTAVIFCVGTSGYDQCLYEDNRVGRIDESLKLFDEICNSEWFTDISLILFLNKRDLFEKKVKVVDMSCAFPEYRGGLNYAKASAYMRKTFIELNRNPQKKQIYPHFTCATNTDNIKFVFNAVKTIIFRRAVADTGF
mmetsp:Transcript_28985/g.32198  ORF Transcript_28985/g.32198 Transcript_28985/m.32198 type:complete len:349 (+) Transcript_28985:37-1083(+)